MTGALIAHLWQSTLFAGAVGVMTLVFRGNRAKVRYWLWLSASLKFLVPFSLLIGLGGHMGWTPAAQKIGAPIATDVSFAVERITLMAEPFSGPARPAPSTPGTFDWTAIAVGAVWICGFAAIALIRLRVWLRIRAAVRASAALEIPEPAVGPVEIRSSAALLEPGVVGLDLFGWSRPILLLPAGIAECLTPPQLEAVLAHELCHVRRRDNLFASMHMIVEAIFWFHPPVWWIGARLVEERERACDESVLSLGAEPRIYADAILNVCKLYLQSPLVCVAGVTGSNLKRRIEAIMTNRTGGALSRAKKFLLASAGTAALMGPVAIGVVIGIGHAPSVRAQAAAAAELLEVDAPAAPAVPAVETAETPTEQAAAPAPQVLYKDRRMLVMLFDLPAMTPDEQSRASKAALKFLQSQMTPADLVAVMIVNNGSVAVRQDFTDDRAALESAVQNIALNVNSSVSVIAPSPLTLEMAARMLAALPQKKALLYFSTGFERLRLDDQARLQNAIETARQANVAFYPIDARGVDPTTVFPSAPSGNSMLPQPAPTASSDEQSKRRFTAIEKFGSISSAMARTYIKYGPPDQIEDRSASPQNPAQIWRYNYLDNFHSRAEFEFPLGNSSNVRINWPPPLATFEGAPAAAPALADALNRELRNRGEASQSNTISGLPGRHASLQIYPEPEFQRLSVPLDSLSGRVDIMAQIKMLQDTSAPGSVVANLRDVVQASAGTYEIGFTLSAGSYVCSLVVRSQATGQMYTETINFDVK